MAEKYIFNEYLSYDIRVDSEVIRLRVDSRGREFIVLHDLVSYLQYSNLTYLQRLMDKKHIYQIEAGKKVWLGPYEFCRKWMSTLRGFRSEKARKFIAIADSVINNIRNGEDIPPERGECCVDTDLQTYVDLVAEFRDFSERFEAFLNRVPRRRKIDMDGGGKHVSADQKTALHAPRYDSLPGGHAGIPSSVYAGTLAG